MSYRGRSHCHEIVCVTSEIAIIDPDDGLSPDLRQAIISTNAVLLLIGPYFSR